MKTNIDTDTIDHLFLELSQFTKATTAKELHMKMVIDQIYRAANGTDQVANDDTEALNWIINYINSHKLNP